MRREVQISLGVLTAAGVAWGISALWQYRGSYESSTADRLRGFGYTVSPSKFRADLVRLDARSTAFPLQLVDESLKKGKR